MIAFTQDEYKIIYDILSQISVRPGQSRQLIEVEMILEKVGEELKIPKTPGDPGQ